MIQENAFQYTNGRELSTAFQKLLSNIPFANKSMAKGPCATAANTGITKLGLADELGK